MRLPLNFFGARLRWAPSPAPAMAHTPPQMAEPTWRAGWPAGVDPVSGPRPAMQPVLAGARHALALQALAQRPSQAVAVAMKLPFCAMQCLCCERPVRAAQDLPTLDAYVDALLDELQRVSRQVGTGREVLQLHLGGGTATTLGERNLMRLVQALQGPFRLPDDAEMSVDCDPRRIGALELRLLADLGFRQVNLRTLEVDPEVLQAVGRRQALAVVDNACELARANGIDYINMELMIGLPGQTLAGWQASLQRVVALAPDRITLLRYEHRPGRLANQQHIDIQAHALPDEALIQAMALHTSRTLCGAGYRWLGAEQFVLDTDELALALDQGRLRRSLLAYTATPAMPTLGLGAGAVSEIDGQVFWSPDTVADWHQALRAGSLPTVQARQATPRRQRHDQAVQQLLCSQQLSLDTLDPVAQAQLLTLAATEARGLLRVSADRISVTEEGRHALPWLCLVMDEQGRADEQDERGGRDAGAAQAPVSPWLS